MKIQVRLLKPKKKHTSFYKTDQIQFKNIKNLQEIKFRSTEKVITSHDPWTHLSNQQIENLVDRLQDKPQMLYKVIKTKNQLSATQKRKFLKLNKQNYEIKDKLKQKIKLKRLEYEEQYKNLFRQKNKLVIMTDLPKIGKIKAITNSHQSLKTNNIIKPKKQAFKDKVIE